MLSQNSLAVQYIRDFRVIVAFQLLLRKSKTAGTNKCLFLVSKMEVRPPEAKGLSIYHVRRGFLRLKVRAAIEQPVVVSSSRFLRPSIPGALLFWAVMYNVVSSLLCCTTPTGRSGGQAPFLHVVVETNAQLQPATTVPESSVSPEGHSSWLNAGSWNKVLESGAPPKPFAASMPIAKSAQIAARMLDSPLISLVSSMDSRQKRASVFKSLSAHGNSKFLM